jgi:hypothetical protein
MSRQPEQVARINRHEVTDLPAEWNNQERGQYLRMLFRLKGIEPDRFYRVTYHPLSRCWVMIQEAAWTSTLREETPGSAQTAEQFYLQVLTEFRWKARVACAALAAHSLHFACFGRAYQLPEKPQELTPADLVNQLGGPLAGEDGSPAL